MKSSNTIDRTYTISELTPAQNAWLRTQLIVCIKIRKLWEQARESNKLAPTLFGVRRDTLAKAVPEAVHLSGYVNHGMCGRSLESLQTDFATGFQYSPSNRTGVYQTETNDLYLSGFPGGVVKLVAPDPIPEGMSIISVRFHMDKHTQQWSATICTKYRRAKPPAKRH